MKALQIWILFAFLSSALAGVDVEEITALVNIRNHVTGLDTLWTDDRLQHACETGWEDQLFSCSEGHIYSIHFGFISDSLPPIGTLGNITGLRFIQILTLGPDMQVPDLDAWYTQLPSLIVLSFNSRFANPTPRFSGNFTQNPMLTTFIYREHATSVQWKIVSAPNLKSLSISMPYLTSEIRSDFLSGLNLTYLSFSVSEPSTLVTYPDFSHLRYLETLDMSRTAILELPDSFSNLVNLRILILDDCLLVKIPPSVSNCVKLETLSCRSCNLSQSDSIPDLSSTRLNRLILSGAGITTWPEGLCQLSTNPAAPGLTLDLAFNAISNPPDCFAKTTKLYALTFDGPELTSFPNVERMSSLTTLIIKGAHKMKNDIPDLSGIPLDTLDLTDCGLTGNFPTTLPPTLTILLLSGNRLTGNISDTIFACLSSLSVLVLSDNDLSGAFPSSIGMTKVRYLKAPNNSFTSLPDSIGNLPLFFVDFSKNNLSSIPSDDVWGNITSLTDFYLHNNRHLNGPLPVFWSKAYAAVRNVDLSGCSFTGNVPSISSGVLDSVILSDNALDGIILPSVYAHGMSTFKVDRNVLTGTIPPSMGERFTTGFFQVRMLDFSFNRLTGSIPSTFQQIFDTSHILEFYFNNNEIDGPLPNLTLAMSLRIFKGDRTKVRLCVVNPNIRPGAQCTLTDVGYPGACGCESWYTSCTTTSMTCPAPGYVAPVEPPGKTAPAPILPPGSDPLIPPGVLPPPQPPSFSIIPRLTCPVPAAIPVGSVSSISSSLVIFILTLVSILI